MIDAITDDSLAPSVAVGVLAGILAQLLHIGYLRRSQSTGDGEIRDEFAVVTPPPDPPHASSPDSITTQAHTADRDPSSSQRQRVR